VKATLDCLECMITQALRAARRATPDEALQRQILNEMMKRIPAMDMNESPAALSLAVYEITSAVSGVFDPYLDAKRMQNEMALALEDEMREMVRTSADPLDAALHLAAAGNVIDLGTMRTHEINIREAIGQVMHERFSVDHSEAFRASLAQCKDLLFLLDNAGEIVFDKILIEELIKHTHVTAVVKAGPIINDALMEDAEQVGLTKVCEIIDNGGAFVGSPIHLVPPRFLERMRKADVILGKGQGNYETVDELEGADVFFILRAKCVVVAEKMGVNFGQVGLISNRMRAMTH
jgi:damage-control phosphatase, subfamily I